MANYLYTAENEYAPEFLHEFGHWYANRHAPDVFRLGFQSAASYRAVEGGLNVFGIYEIPSPDIFLTPDYKSIGGLDPHRAAVIEGRVSRRAYTLYEQRLLHPAGGGGDVPRLNADWLSVLRFAAQDAVDPEIARAVEAEGVLPASAGLMRVRFGRRKGERPDSVTDRPSCILVAEFASRPDEGAATWLPLTERFEGSFSNVMYYTGYRAYPWRNDPGLV